MRRFLIASLFLLLLYGWTLTESATVTIRVADGRCEALLYGRASAIDCPGLPGGSLDTYVGRAESAALAAGRGPLNWLVPETDWDRVELATDHASPIARPQTTNQGSLPSSFTLRARLLRPNDPGGLVLRRPGEQSGWMFVVDGENRRGAWWEWTDGAPGRPLRGIPLDKPLVGQTQSLIRLALDGWQGAVTIIALALALRVFGREISESVAGGRWSVVSTWAAGIFPARVMVGRLTITIAAILFIFAVALHVAVDVLERAPHVQDSVTYLFQAQTLARGALTAPAPPLAAADHTAHFAQEFLLVRDGRWFGKYPPGYPAVLALGVITGAPWLVNPHLAALTVALVGAVARTLYAGRRQPATGNGLSATDYAPLLLAVSPFFLVMSGSLMAHPAELFWATLFMAGWARALRGRRWRGRWALVAGAALGMLFLTRQFTAVTVGVAFGAALVLADRRRPSAGTRQPTTDIGRAPSPLRPLPLSYLLLVACPLFLAVLALLAYQNAVTGDPTSDPRLLYWPYDRVGFGPGIGEAENVFSYAATSVGPAIQWVEDPAQPPRGHTVSRGLYNLGRNLSALEEDLFGWPALFTLSFVWLAFLLRRPAAVDWVLLVVALAVAGGYVAYWASGIAYGPRYFYAALPALVILTARGVGALAEVIGRRMAAIILLAMLTYGLVSLPARLDGYRDYNFVDPGARAAAEAAVEPPALVFVAASQNDWWEYGAFFSGNTPWLDGPVIFARDLGTPENARLAARFPGREVFYWDEIETTN